MEEKALKEGFRQARAVTKEFARSFYFASLFLPADKQKAAYAVYAICRKSDETVDSENFGDKEKLVKKLEDDIRLAYSQKQLKQPLLLAFRQAVNDYAIPGEYFETLLEGMRMDISVNRYADFKSLREYCYKVAGVVGLMILKIFGYKEKNAEEYAVKLGIAMQLTNILRDIKEDLARQRIYLPIDEMDKFGVSAATLEKGKVDEKIIQLLRFQIARCRAYYAESSPGIRLIKDPRCRFVATAMKEFYCQILEAIEKNGYDLFSVRAHVNTFAKIKLTAKVFIQGKYL
jgi:phytoene synthase